MKPSINPEVSAVLTTNAELSVVLDAIQHDSEPNDISIRFYEQTRRFIEPQLFTFPCAGFAGETWKQDARFEVLTQDESFVLAAAARVVGERQYRKRIMHAVDGTAVAAAHLFAHFSTDRQWRFM